MKTQKLLFDEIKKKIGVADLWASQLSELLCLSRDAIYRRERGEVLLNIRELHLICATYGIDLGMLADDISSKITFDFVNINLSQIDKYRSYLERIKFLLIKLVNAKKREILFCADDIPIFHFMHFPELTYFKLYVWSQSLRNLEISLQYEDFVNEMKKSTLEPLFQELHDLYLGIPSREIWTTSTIQPFLTQLDYYEQIGSFALTTTKFLLVEQMKSLLLNLQNWTLNKYKNKDIRFDLYLTPVSLGISQMLCIYDGKFTASLKLYTINSITTTNSNYIKENLQWMKAIMNKSTCLSRTSEKDRIQFFKSMQKQVDSVWSK
ncbi:hypothetical protein [Sphingobacterium hungaricum]